MDYKTRLSLSDIGRMGNGSVKSQKRLYLFELYKQIITTIKSQDEKIAKIN